MAEVSNLLRRRPPTPPLQRPISSIIGSHLEEAVLEEEEFYNQQNPLIYDFDSFPADNLSNPSFFDDYTTSFDMGFDLNSETENLGFEFEVPNCFFIGDEEDEDQMNYVTHLFEPRTPHVTNVLEDPDMEFGFGPGLRVVGMDSESDSDQFEVNAGFVHDEDDNFNVFRISNHGYQVGEDERDEFEWEEVSERIPYDDSLNLLINRIEEISVSSDFENSSLGDDGEGVELERNIEWEVLLASNNLDMNLEFDNEFPHVNLPQEYILTVEYDPLFEQSIANDNPLQGCPPAAKSVVENLPLLVLTKKDIEENNRVVACAVCKDEFVMAEKVTRLPCSHLYHRDCILPWLGIRNTCPVCRHELPTYDADYEKRKDGRDLFDQFEVRYNFELLP